MRAEEIRKKINILKQVKDHIQKRILHVNEELLYLLKEAGVNLDGYGKYDSTANHKENSAKQNILQKDQ